MKCCDNCKFRGVTVCPGSDCISNGYACWGPETDVCYKQDTGKPRMELLLPLVKSLSEVAKVMEYGCRSMKKNLI